MKNIGFIGLGNMGFPMAANLIKAGFNVTAFDLNQEAVTEIKALGANGVQSLSELESQDIYITMLQKGAQVEAVLKEDGGLFAMANPGTIFIDCSSIDVATTKALYQSAKAQDFEYVDAPVSGGVKGAENASLTFMVGGDKATFDKVEPILQHLGSKIVHAGDAGTGQAAKVCNNMILGISMAAISEAFVLAEKLGLSQEKLFEISSNASGQCWAMTSYSPVPGLVDNVPSNNDYQPGFTAEMMLKDLKLSQDAAKNVSLKTSLGEKALNLYQHLVDEGKGALDFSAIIQLIDKG